MDQNNSLISVAAASSASDGNPHDNSDFNCQICMELMTSPVTTPCGHNFCKSCLTTHITTTGQNSYYSSGVKCPACRGSIQSSVDLLHVNTVLRDMIQRQISAPVPESSTSTTVTVFNNSPCTITMNHSTSPGDKYMYHCAITPPDMGERQPIVVIVCMDLSGSMGTSLPNPTAEKGIKLFTRLDLAKHVCSTTVHMLDSQDVFCIVGFNSTSAIMLKPTLMTLDGKRKADHAIKMLKADGGTNIWSALALMNKVSNKPEFAGRNIISALLTDGETQDDPACARRGIVDTYKLLPRQEKLSVFGFGYDINSKLLYQIASISNCTFGFIPDFSMVGTVFINWLSTALSTASLEKTITITYADGSTSSHSTGLIQFGQARNIIGLSDSAPVSMMLDGTAQGVVSTMQQVLSPMANARFELLNRLQFCIGHDGVGIDYVNIYNKYCSSSDSMVRELMRDIKPAGTDDEGQISMAPRYWAKWGKHYTRAYYTAVLQETCVNFKDPGLQIYGGHLFQTISEAGDKIFRELPAPEATGGVDTIQLNATYGSVAAPGTIAPTQPTTMAAFHNAGGGCWAPGTLVLLADGVTRKCIEDVRRNDMVWTPEGSAVVEYAIEMNRISPLQLMCNYQNVLLITPWHPVKVNNVWRQPADFQIPIDMPVRTVYNMVLSQGHVIDVNGILSCTLGHNFTGDVIQHDFFGNKERIIAALSVQPGFDIGRPVFADLVAIKDSYTGLITGWIDD